MFFCPEQRKAPGRLSEARPQSLPQPHAGRTNRRYPANIAAASTIIPTSIPSAMDFPLSGFTQSVQLHEPAVFFFATTVSGFAILRPLSGIARLCRIPAPGVIFRSDSVP